MSVENYTNNASTSLTAGYTSGSGSITVTTTAGNFPAAAPFRVGIFDTAGALVVLLKVTAITDGTHFAVTAEGTDASASSGATVRHLLTAGGMDGIRADLTQFGTFSSLPNTTGQKQGNRYIVTDGPYEYYYTGSVWQARLASIGDVTPPAPASNWTGVNTGSNWTATDVGGSININIARNASLNWRAIRKTQPSTPYTVTMHARWTAPQENSSTFGLYFYDGTKLMGIEVLIQNTVQTIRVEKITNVTTDNTTLASFANTRGQFMTGGLWFRIVNNSTLSFQWSIDGQVWNVLATETRGTFITPTDYCVGGLCATGVSTDFVNASILSVVLT